MQVILLEKIRNLGDLGDTVSVKSGYGRNYLVPYGKAVTATEKNLAAFNSRKAELEKKAQEKLAHAEKRAQAIVGLGTLSIQALASDEGKLYGSVGPNEIASHLANSNIEVSKQEIAMPEGAFHETGEYEVDIQLHSDVVITVNVVIEAQK